MPGVVVVAPDSFKGVLDAADVAQAIAEGVRAARPGLSVIEAPMADGGEGTLDIILTATNGLRRRCPATGPLGEAIDVPIGLIRGASTAVIETALIAGYAMVPPDQRDPLRTTTFGVGQVIRTAIETELEEIILALGGSATVDGGAGMMQALGLALLDHNGRLMRDPVGGGDLERIGRITFDKPPENLEHIQFTIACDVLNPLCGPLGAAAVFGPQKGADPAGVARLERGLAHWATLIESLAGRPVRDEPGTGAAGGIALPLLGLTLAQIVPGIDLVSETIHLHEIIGDAELVITGEGRLDRQSMMGKVVGAVGRMARSMDVPCIAIAGALGDGSEACNGLLDRVYTLDAPVEETASRLCQVAVRAAEEFL